MSQAHTRARLLAAAERLFAKGGEEATSLRAVTREADANVAAVHYHFGGRDGLLREVLNRHIEPINRRRIELLDALSSDGHPTALEAVVEAFFGAIPALWASVHGAGGFAMGPFADTSLADFRLMLDMNLVTAFLSCREAVKAIRSGGGQNAGG